MKRSTRLTRTAAAAATAAIVAISITSCGGTPASAPSAAVDQKEAGSALVSIAEFLGEVEGGLVVHTAVSALFDLITGGEEVDPDPNKESFEEVNAKLEGISEKLVALQDSVASLTETYDQGNYASTLIALQGCADDISYLYKDSPNGFMWIVKARAKLDGHVTGGADAATLDADRKSLASAIARFKSAYAAGADEYGPAAAKIHDFLMPQGSSVLRDRGQVMMDKGYLTRTDSQALRAEYDLWSEYEATAALMASFYGSLTSGDSDSAAAQQPLTSWAQYRNQEAAALPPTIAAGTVVVTPGGTAKGASVYAPAPSSESTGWLPFDDKGAPLVIGSTPAPNPAATANQALEPFRDTLNPTTSSGSPIDVPITAWAPWSDAEATALAKATSKLAGSTIGQRLSALADKTAPAGTQQSGIKQNWADLASTKRLWTSGTSITGVDCYTKNDPAYPVNWWLSDNGDERVHVTVNYQEHHVLDLTSPDGKIAPIPHAPWAFVDSSAPVITIAFCQSQLGGAVKAGNAADPAGTSGGWMLTRKAGAEENYMAEAE